MPKRELVINYNMDYGVNVPDSMLEHTAHKILIKSMYVNIASMLLIDMIRMLYKEQYHEQVNLFITHNGKRFSVDKDGRSEAFTALPNIYGDILMRLL
jgi:hypothetical protein